MIEAEFAAKQAMAEEKAAVDCVRKAQDKIIALSTAKDIPPPCPTPCPTFDVGPAINALKAKEMADAKALMAAEQLKQAQGCGQKVPPPCPAPCPAPGPAPCPPGPGGVSFMLEKADKMACDCAGKKQRAHQAAAEATALQKASDSAAQARNKKLQAEDAAIQAAASLAAEKEKVAKQEAMKAGDQEADQVRRLASLAETDAADANFLVKKAQELQSHSDALKRKLAAEQAKQVAEKVLTLAVERKNAAAAATAAKRQEEQARIEQNQAIIEAQNADREVADAVANRQRTLDKWQAYRGVVADSWDLRGATLTAQKNAVAATWMAARRSQEAAAADAELQKAINVKDYYDRVAPAHAMLRNANGQLYAVREAEAAQADVATAARNQIAASVVQKAASDAAKQAAMEAQQVQGIKQKMTSESQQRQLQAQEAKKTLEVNRKKRDAKADATRAAVSKQMAENVKAQIQQLNEDSIAMMASKPPVTP